GHAADDRATERPAVLALDVEAAHLPRLYAGRPVALQNGVQVDDQWQPVRLDADSDRPSPGRASARIFKHFYVHPSSVGPVSHLRHCGRAVHEVWTTRLGPKLTVLVTEITRESLACTFIAPGSSEMAQPPIQR